MAAGRILVAAIMLVLSGVLPFIFVDRTIQFSGFTRSPLVNPREFGGVLGGVPGSVRLAINGSHPATPLENTERMVVRTGTLEIFVVDPLQAAEQLRDLATHLSGFVVSSRVTGSDERSRSAQVTVRIPAKYFDEARDRKSTRLNSSHGY